MREIGPLRIGKHNNSVNCHLLLAPTLRKR